MGSSQFDHFVHTNLFTFFFSGFESNALAISYSGIGFTCMRWVLLGVIDSIAIVLKFVAF